MVVEMANILSRRSLKRLEGVEPILRLIVIEANKESKYDFMVLEGARTLEKQKQYLKRGSTKTLKSLHLKQPPLTANQLEILKLKPELQATEPKARAVDICPCPKKGIIPWNHKFKFREYQRAMFKVAEKYGVKLRWGGDWNQNGSSDDERFYDGPHFELPRKVYP